MATFFIFHKNMLKIYFIFNLNINYFFMKKHYYKTKLFLSSVTLMLTAWSAQAQFPAPYCANLFPDGVEPITSVSFAGIVNTSSNSLTGGAPMEDFTAVTGGIVAPTLTYPITVKGNTGGSWTNYIRVYFDWNHDNDFTDAGESFNIGTIFNSSGLDAVQATANILIPANAMQGATRMRVMKRYSAHGEACNTTGFGQSEDYVITVTAPPTCLAPTQINVTAQATTAVAVWTPPATAPSGGYEYIYMATNTPPTPSTSGTDSATAGASLSGLTPNTTYYLWVRSDCGGGDMSLWSPAAIFTTTCVASIAPFSEDFDAGVIPGCWSTTSSNPVANGLWKFTGAVDYDPGNTRPDGTFAWVDGSTPTNMNNVTLLSPLIDVTPLNVPELVFDYFSNNTGIYPNNVFKVEIFNGTTWVQLFTDNTNLADWRTIKIPLPAYADQTIQLRFIVDKTIAPVDNAFYNDILLDNVEIHEAPTCVPPSAVQVSGATKNSATIMWTAAPVVPVAGYDIYYSDSDNAPGAATAPNGGNTTALTTSLAGLTPSTTYHVWVRANCGGTDGPSEWIAAASFTTLCDYPTLTGTTPATICGQGSAALQATASGSGNLFWYDAPANGNYMGSGATFNTPVITQTTNYYVSAGTVLPNSFIAIGAGTQTSAGAGNSPYYHGWGGNKTQYIIRASELQAAGMAAGPINSLTYNITSLGTATFNDFVVSIGSTTQNVATTTHIDNLTPVYSNGAQDLALGENTYDFDVPFIWDGVSNIVVQTCYSNTNTGGSSSAVSYTTTSYVSGTYTYADNQSAEDICGTVTGSVNGSGGTATVSARPNIIFNASSLCASPRQMVTATVTNAVAITAEASDAVICETEETVLSVSSANANYTYVWMPGNLAGPSHMVAPTTTTTYTVTATDNSTNCVTSQQVVVTVHPLPVPVSTSAPATACMGSIVPLTATGGMAAPLGDYCEPVVFGNPGDTGDYLNNFSFAGIVNNDSGDAENDYTLYDDMTASVVAGTPYTATFEAGGTTGLYAQQFGVFIDYNHNGAFEASELAYASTTSTFSPTVTSGSITVPVTAYNGTTRMRVVSRYSAVITGTNACAIGDIVNGTFGEFEDYMITITGGTNAAEYVWTPTTGLFTDAAGTVAYTGTNAATVYALVSGSTSYAVTSTAITGCTSDDDLFINATTVSQPTGSTTQIITVNAASEATIEDIVVNETGVIWYDDEQEALNHVNPLAPGTMVTSGSTYYGVLLSGNCYSSPLAVTVQVVLGNDDFSMGSFTYHPNPVKNVLSITYTSDITSVTVHNLLGQQVLAKEVNATETAVDMSALADGAYIVNVSSGNSVKSIKVIKKQ